MLRVIDFGVVTPLRSQTLWHAVAYGVSDGQPATLSFARPSAPYVCVGYHRDLAEVDQDYCRAHDMPVYRRMVGGGPVYLDDGQLFFQICLPVAAVPASRLDALRMLLTPAVTAFRAVGVAAHLDAGTEICLGEAKICGHGAGQIGDAVVVCGNLIERFDHERATRVLALADPVQRAETLRLMRRYVAATPVGAGAFSRAIANAYAAALGLAPAPGGLTAGERSRLAALDAKFTSAEWLSGPRRVGAPARPRQVKVRAGVWTVAAQAGPARVIASVVAGTVDRAHLTAPGLDGSIEAAQRAVSGVPMTAVPGALARFGEPGRQLAAAFATADGKRL
jgi:lipoate-protein ligase A